MQNIVFILIVAFVSSPALAGKKSKCDIYDGEKEKKKEKDKDFLEVLKPLLPPVAEIRAFTVERYPLVSEEKIGDAVAELIQHLGFVRKQEENANNIKKNKSVRLGAPLENDITIEFEFEPNDRPEKKIFDVRSIILVEKNGNEHIISEDPTISEGTDFRRQKFSYLVEQEPSEGGRLKDNTVSILNEKGLKDLRKKAEAIGAVFKTDIFENSELLGFLNGIPRKISPSDRSIIRKAGEREPIRLRVPVFLRAEIIAEFKKWIPRLPYLEPAELRNVKSKEDLSYLYWKYQYRQKTTALRKINSSQLGKWGVRGGWLVVLWYLLDLRIDLVDQIINNTKEKIQSGIKFLSPEEEKVVMQKFEVERNKEGQPALMEYSFEDEQMGLDSALTVLETQKKVHFKGTIRSESDPKGKSVSVLVDGNENPLLYSDILALVIASVHPPK